MVMLKKEIFSSIYLKTFFKAQLSSLSATGVDFTVTFLLTSVISCWYLFSSVTGTIAGGICNFLINKYLVYNTKGQQKAAQIIRFIVVWFSSMLLNNGGVYVLTDILKIYYLFSKVITAVLIGVFFNFYFQKTFVFKYSERE